ncbi:MAG: type II secretion system secretin GspD [Planctomycetes bacterium]|nr:type II secretion system secretin GspD [Planctomycetota bacterium]
MELKSSKTNRRKQHILLDGFFYLMCIFCLGFAGCQPESEIVAVTPGQENGTQSTESPGAEGLTTKKIEHIDGTGGNLAEKSEPMALTTFPKPEMTENNRKALRYESKVTAAQEGTIPAPVTTRIHSLGIISPPSDSTIPIVEQSYSETPVHLPMLDEPGKADELIYVNFDQVDIRVMLKTIGDITGINFIVDDSIRGTVTLMSPTKIRLGEIYDVLESILDVKGYAAVPAGSGNLVKIVPRAEAIKRNLQVRIGSNPSEIPKNDSLVTQIIRLKYADVTEVSQIIRPLLATGLHMATYPRTNSIIVTDTSSNIHHIAKIIDNLDVPGSQEQVTIIGLTYASAEVLSEQITRIMDKSKVVSSQPGRSRTVPKIETGIKILPDIRTNSLIVVANAQDTDTIERLAKQLDTQRPRGTNNVHVVYLKNAQATDTAQSLTGALANMRIAGAIEGAQNVQVTADEGTNALIITASAQDFEVIAEIIEKLDIVREQVLVEMLIIEVSEDSLKEIGIDWATFDQAVDGSVRFFGETGFGIRSGFVNRNLEGLAVGAWRGSGENVRIGAILHALEKVSGVNILSTPHIITSNHQKAKIIVGENIPYIVESRITEIDLDTPSVIDRFEYKDVGISLEITPHISQGGLVRLEIDSEFTKLIEGVTGTSVNTPTTAKRQAQTVVSIKSGSTIVIGGLMRDDKTTIEKKIPLLGDLPLIGGLFRFQRDRLQKTNLLIFITPHILSNQEDLEQITEKKKNEMKSALKELGKKNNEH